MHFELVTVKLKHCLSKNKTFFPTQERQISALTVQVLHKALVLSHGMHFGLS